jgi:hypothetical protein
MDALAEWFAAAGRGIDTGSEDGHSCT